MILRINTVPLTLSPEQIDQFSQVWRDNLEQHRSQIQGLSKVYLVADRDRGAVKVVGLWESEEAMAAAEPIVAQLRQQMATAMGQPSTTVPGMEAYEVLVEA